MELIDSLIQGEKNKDKNSNLTKGRVTTMLNNIFVVFPEMTAAQHLYNIINHRTKDVYHWSDLDLLESIEKYYNKLDSSKDEDND